MAKVAVLGCGHGAHAVAGFLAIKGHEVTLVGADPVDVDRVSAINEKGGIEVRGVVSGFGRVKASLSVEEGVRGRDYVFLVVPAYAHRYFVQRLLPVLEDRKVLIMPDNWGSLTLLKALKSFGKEFRGLVGGTSSLPFACRLSGSARVDVFAIKDAGSVHLASIPSARTQELLSEVKEVFYEFTAAKNILEVVLNNMNLPLYPVTTLLNLGRVEYAGGGFNIHREGITPSVVKVIEAVDEERRSVGRELGLRLPSLYELVSSMYKSSGVKGRDLYELLSTSPVHAKTGGPDSIRHRYVVEDVPYGLVPILSLCEQLGLSCPTTRAVVHLLSTALGEDLVGKGITVKRLGWGRYGKEEILKEVELGP